MAPDLPGPDFICIGAQKAGTGWLYEQLRSHPDFWMPPLKEVHYFDRITKSRAGRDEKLPDRLEGVVARDERDREFIATMQKLDARSEIDFATYAALFQPKRSLIAGDITPGYSTLSDDIVRRISAAFPKSKVIFIARDPVERAWSQLSMWVRHSIIQPFGVNDVAAVLRNLQLPGVTARSYPAVIVRRWRQFVNRDLFQVFFFDDLRANPAAVRQAIISFLGGDAGKASGGLAA